MILFMAFINSISMKKTAVWLILILTLSVASSAQKNSHKGIPSFKWMKEVGAKTKPSAHTLYNVSDFGAVADTSVLSTKAIQAAIDACSAKGGGVVTFAPGNYCTGSIFLKSGVNLNIPAGVQLFGSQNLEQYPIIDTRVAGIEMKWPAALISAIDQNNVEISGKGKVWGQGKVFWEKYWTMRRAYDKKGLRWIVDYDCMRPRLILMQNCQNVTLTETNFFEAGFWTVHILYSQDVTIDGILVNNNNAGKGPSTDGIDIDSSCRILIQNCDISCNDDNFCLKAGRDADGLRVNRPTEYVVIRNCIARQGDGLFTCGSETSGDIRNVVTYNMTALGTKVGMRFKSALNRGGTVENIYLSNIRMKDIRDPFQINLNWNPAYSYSELPEGFESDSVPEHWKVMLTKVSEDQALPTFRNIYFTNIHAENCKVALICEGVKDSRIENFHLTNVHITAEDPGRMYWAKDWTLKNVSIGGENGERVDMQNSENVPLYK
jgi:polygalacturonase